MDQLIIQGIGYIALLFVLLSFQKNKRVTILLLMLIGLVLFIVHYALLTAWTGSVMNLIETGMVYVAYKKETDRWAKYVIWPYIFIVVFILAGIVTATSWIDFLPAIAQSFGTIAVWQINPKTIRFLMLIPRPLWFIYNYTVGSYAGMTAEILILASVLIGILRFDILKQKKKS